MHCDQSLCENPEAVSLERGGGQVQLDSPFVQAFRGQVPVLTSLLTGSVTLDFCFLFQLSKRQRWGQLDSKSTRSGVTAPSLWPLLVTLSKSTHSGRSVKKFILCDPFLWPRLAAFGVCWPQCMLSVSVGQPCQITTQIDGCFTSSGVWKVTLSTLWKRHSHHTYPPTLTLGWA